MAASTVCARPSTFRGPSARKTFSGKATRGVRAAGQFKVRIGDPGRHQDEDEIEVTQALFVSAAEGDWLLRAGTLVGSADSIFCVFPCRCAHTPSL